MREKGDAVKIRVGGDLGDATASLCAIKAVPDGPHDIYFVDRRPTVAPFLERENIIRPLYEACPYVRAVHIGEDAVDIDLTDFRKHFSNKRTLAMTQKVHLESLGVDMGAYDQTSAWIPVTGKPHDRIVLHRSPRYRNPHFPWKKLVRYFGERCVFVGLPHEHEDFQNVVGTSVERMTFPNLLMLAEFAAGARWSVGNQSAPFNVFEAIKTPRILEVCLWQPDCLYLDHKPENVIHCADGSMTVDGEVFESPISEFKPEVRETPPGFWQYPGYTTTPVLSLLVKAVSRREGISVDEAHQKVYLHNCLRCPRFFRNPARDLELTRFRTALENA